MDLYPAIDLKAGQCVRLKQGRMDEATIYNSDPLAQATAFINTGVKRLHIVDLDGAFAGQSINGAVVRDIVQEVGVPVQLGGGIRTMEAVEGWFDCGLSRVIIGSAAVEDPDFLYAAAEKYPHQIILGLDTRNSEVMIKGWAEGSGMALKEIAVRYANLPLAGIVHTDIARDGMKTGVNHQATEALGAMTNIPVIASGGLGSMRDVEALLRCQHIAGVISGRALYDGSLDLAELLKVMD